LNFVLKGECLKKLRFSFPLKVPNVSTFVQILAGRTNPTFHINTLKQYLQFYNTENVYHTYTQADTHTYSIRSTVMYQIMGSGSGWLSKV